MSICRPTFCKSLIVSVAVSKFGFSELGYIFAESRVKVDGKYYGEVLLMKQMLLVMRRIAGNTFVFQRASAPVYCARETLQLLQ